MLLATVQYHNAVSYTTYSNTQLSHFLQQF